MNGYKYSYIDFHGKKKDSLDDIIYIKYIISEKVVFKTVEGKLKNGKYKAILTFKNSFFSFL
ncbi:hypothetical protein [Paraclostridium sp.]|uniref:hypothetical protein n=1 Tax=Paraclostridium sp. TaxID=2023273 RepID=UPI003F66C61B